MQVTDPSPAAKGSTYIELLIDVWPVLLMGFLVAWFRGWAGVKDSYRHRSTLETMANIFVSSAVMAVFAVGVAWCLPMVGIDTSDPAMFMGIVVMLSGIGMKGFDALIRKKAGFSILNLQDAEHLKDAHAKLDDQQRLEHVRRCPFQRECAICNGCQGVLNGESNEKTDHIR